MAHTSLISLSQITVPSTREARIPRAAMAPPTTTRIRVPSWWATARERAGGPHRSTAIDGPPTTPHDEGPRGERGPSGSP